MLGLWLITLLLAGCAQDNGELRPTEPPQVQTVEVEVTRVVYRETLVTPTPSPPIPCSPERLADASEVVIGALLPLSAPGAWMRSANMQMGLNLALERLNSAGVGGTPLRLVLYDSVDDPVRSAQLAEKLIVEDCAAGLITGLGDAATMSVMEVTERFRKPTIVIDATSAQITEGQPQSTFRLAPVAEMVARTPANWLADVGDYNDDGSVQAVIIAENTTAGDLFVEQSNVWFPQNGIRYDVHRVDLPMTDFSPEIARLLAMPTIPDAVFISITSDGALSLHQQLFDAGIRPDKGTLVVNHSRRALDPAAFGLSNTLGVGTIVSRRGPWPSVATEAGRYLFDRYRQSGLARPELGTFLAHDALLLLVDAMQRSSSLVGMEISKALESSDIELAAGHYSFPYGSTQPPDGETTPLYAWHQWMTPPLLYLVYTEDGQDPSTLPAIWPETFRTLSELALP